MAQRKTVAGRRSCVLYTVILATLALIVAGIVLVLIVHPELERRHQAVVRLEQAETHYQAGIAFQNVGDWEAAEAEFKQVITIDPNYKDVQTRLSEMKARLAESKATATADAQAVATTQARATAIAQAVAATATMDAVEAHYQKGIAYINLKKWIQAQMELEAVFEIDPNYKDVQAQLAVVNSEVAKLTPTATPTPSVTPTPAHTSTPTPSPTPLLLFFDDFSKDPSTSGHWRIYRLHADDTETEASWDSDSQVLYLTRASNVKGIAMFADHKLTETRWEAEFRYKVGGGSGADGFVFMFYKDEASYGEPGCGGTLGFQSSISPIADNYNCTPRNKIAGYGVEFDGHLNSVSDDKIADPSSNHIALVRDSVSNHLAYTDDARTEDDTWHHALIQFDNGHVTVRIDGELVLNHFIEDFDYTHSGVGFSSGTGGLTNNHIIDDFVLRAAEP